MNTDKKQLIINLYSDRQMTQKEIAVLLNHDQGNLSREMKKLGIPTRSYSEAQKQYWASGADTTKQRANLVHGYNKGLAMPDEQKKKISLSNQGKHRQAPSEETKHKMSLSHKANPNRYWLGKKRPDMSAIAKANNYGIKVMRLAHLKPNKVEARLNAILQAYFPGEWSFTGDGSVIFGGLCPDFINVNGQKTIIEVFGSYWHNPSKRKLRFNQTVEGRIEAFKAFGFKTLVLWDYEIKRLPEAELVNRIKMLEAM